MKWSEIKYNIGLWMPKLLISFINKKNIPWNSRIRTMKQNCIIFSNQLIHVWHEVIQNVSVVLNTHGMGEQRGQ